MTSVRETGEVEFRFYRATAADVKLAGDFTGWLQSPLAMSTAGDGWWTAVAKLEAGDYRFRYFVDGAWFTDFAANGIEYTKEGIDSVLVVCKPRTQNKTSKLVELAA